MVIKILVVTLLLSTLFASITTSILLVSSTTVTDINTNVVSNSTSSFVIRDIDSSIEEPQQHNHHQPIALAQIRGGGEQEQSLQQPDIKWISPSDFLELVKYLFDQAKNVPYTNFLIIDTRNSNEYNGWKSFDAIYAALDFNRTGLQPLYDMKNGHVVDAHNFDADWLHLFDPDALKSVITERIGIRLKQQVMSSDQPDLIPILPLVLYDTKRARLERVKQYLVDNFAVNLVYLCHMDDRELSDLVSRTANISGGGLFFQEPFYDMLLSPEVLNAILRPYNHSNRILLKPIAEYKLFDVSSTRPDVHYDRSHIPTAVHLNTNDLEGTDHKRKSKDELARLLLEYGIKPNNSEMIILYGNPDPMAGFRAALIWKSMGVKDVRVLNGGIRAWLSKSLPIEASSSAIKKRGSLNNGLNSKEAVGVEAKKARPPDDQETALLIRQFIDQSMYAQNPINYLVDQNYVLDLVKNYDLFADQYALVDVRSYDEHVGRVSGYEALSSRGRIPTSLWGRGGSSPDQLEDYRNPDLTMRSGVELLKMWDQLGIDYKYKHLVFYCGNGWRASEVMFYAELMGLYRISMYDGGWWDWTSSGNNSIALGPTSLNMSLEFVDLPPSASAGGSSKPSGSAANVDDEAKIAHPHHSTSSIDISTTSIIEMSSTLAPSSATTTTMQKTTPTKPLKQQPHQVSNIHHSSASASSSSSSSHDPSKTQQATKTHHNSSSSSDVYYKNQFEYVTSTVPHSSSSSLPLINTRLLLVVVVVLYVFISFFDSSSFL